MSPGSNRSCGRSELEVCYYGHAATGLLHVRPVLDLHTAGDMRKYRPGRRPGLGARPAIQRIARGRARCRHGAHGIHGGAGGRRAARRHAPDQGALRSEEPVQSRQDFQRRALQDRQPPAGRSRGALCLPFEPALAFAFKDESFIGNLEQCNGCGGCRKDAPTMCPTFLATGEEYMSTRGRANAIRAALELRFQDDPLRARRARCRAQQLPLLQGLHGGVPVEREPGAAESGADACAASPRWFAVAGADAEQCRLVRPAGLHDAGAGERVAGFAYDPWADAEGARINRQTSVAALHEAAV